MAVSSGSRACECDTRNMAFVSDHVNILLWCASILLIHMPERTIVKRTRFENRRPIFPSSLHSSPFARRSLIFVHPPTSLFNKYSVFWSERVFFLTDYSVCTHLAPNTLRRSDLLDPKSLGIQASSCCYPGSCAQPSHCLLARAWLRQTFPHTKRINLCCLHSDSCLKTFPIINVSLS